MAHPVATSASILLSPPGSAHGGALMARRKLLAFGFAIGSAAMLAAAGGGWAFLSKPVGAAFTALWLTWWSALILGYLMTFTGLPTLSGERA